MPCWSCASEMYPNVTGIPASCICSNIREGRTGEKPGNPRLVERVCDRVAVKVVHDTAAASDRRIHVFRSEQAKVAVVATRFIRQKIRPRVWVVGAAFDAIASLNSGEPAAKLAPQLSSDGFTKGNN